MATLADQRLLELLDKWLASLELHAKYCSLDEASYAKIQPWPRHQRPSRWIIDLASQKAAALRAQIEERIAMGDVKFGESLELMTFLANLVGSEHIERFIPLADPGSEQPVSLEPPDGAPSVPVETSATGTREMPRFSGGMARPEPVANEAVARSERKAAPVKAAAKGVPPVLSASEIVPKPMKSDATAKPYDKNAPTDATREQVIADATRLVQWGRKWFELAELIASMADRPHVTDVRRILKDNKAIIDEKAGRT